MLVCDITPSSLRSVHISVGLSGMALLPVVMVLNMFVNEMLIKHVIPCPIQSNGSELIWSPPVDWTERGNRASWTEISLL